MLFDGKVKEVFDVESVISSAMEQKLKECSDIYRGEPYWMDTEDHVKTINFAKTICSETARLTTLGISIKFDGSVRSEWLQKQIDKEFFNIRNWVEYATAFGTVVLKPNGESIDMYTPGKFKITDQHDGETTGVVFVNQDYRPENKKYYTRLEYHRFLENGLYAITNKCFVGDSENDLKKTIAIEETPWSGLMEEVVIQNMISPLYAVLKTPLANNIDINSPLSLPIFADAIEELKDLDVAYSRNSKEIYDSKRTVLIDSDRLLPSGRKIDSVSGKAFEAKRQELNLPDYVKNVYGNGTDDFYQEINPSLSTTERLNGINALLSQIGFKCGFSNGYFVFNEKTGMVTATQVEADDRRTIQFIKDVRDKLEKCLNDLIYAINVFADLYDLAPLGDYEVAYDFGDITYNHEEDRARWYSYALQNKIPFYVYLMKFEGMTEDEAKALVAEAQPKETRLFGGVE